jgi:hypothetical protein
MNTRTAEPNAHGEIGRTFRAADFLALAASPVFALMAVFTLTQVNARDMLCSAAGGAEWNGMGAMYVLMCIAHLPIWLKRLAR